MGIHARNKCDLILLEVETMPDDPNLPKLSAAEEARLKALEEVKKRTPAEEAEMKALKRRAAVWGT